MIYVHDFHRNFMISWFVTVCVRDFHNLCPRLSQRGSFGESCKVGVMEFGLYGAWPFIHLSLRPVWAAYSRTKGVGKSKISANVFLGMSNWCAYFQLKQWNVSITVCQKLDVCSALWLTGTVRTKPETSLYYNRQHYLIDDCLEDNREDY